MPVLSYKITFLMSIFVGVNIRRVSMMSSELLNSVPDVEIEPEGTFKYVLIRVYAPQTKDGNEPSKMIVRGNSRGPYHGKNNF